MEATTRLTFVKHQVTLRGGGGGAGGEPSSMSMMKRDKDRERHRRRLLSRSMVYVNQVASTSAFAEQQQQQQFNGRQAAICHERQRAPIRSAPGTRPRRMSDFSDQTLAKLNDLKLDEAPPATSTNFGPQAGQLQLQRHQPQQQQQQQHQQQRQRQHMELAEAQQEQPLVVASSEHESRFEPEAGRFGQQQQQSHQQSTSHFAKTERPQMQTGGGSFVAGQDQNQQHQSSSSSFPVMHQLGLSEVHQQVPHFHYHEPAPTPFFQAQQHSHAAGYYPLLGPTHQSIDLVYSQSTAPSSANYADLDETTRQRQQQQQAIELKCEPVALPDSVLRLNQMAERSHQRLASSNASSHELHHSNYSNHQQQQQQRQQYYDNNNQFEQSAHHELTVLDAAANSSMASSHKLDQSANYEQHQYHQHQHQTMSNSMASVGSSMGPRSMYASANSNQHQMLSASQQSQASLHSSIDQFAANSRSTEQLCGESAADNGDELKVCEWFGCSNTFLDMAEFVRHLEEVHVNQEPREKSRYFCLWSNCKRNNQEFNARYKLLIHMRVHSGEKPYACKSPDCKKSFSRLENLKIHVRSHTGHKPYKCTHGCSKSFTNSSDRIKHHKTHKDPKPYNCTIDGCTKRYTDPSSLRKHLRAHKRHGREMNQSGGQMLYSSSARLRHSTLSSCDLNSSGYQNSSSYQNYSSSSGVASQQPEVQYQSDQLYVEQQQQNTIDTYQLAADYDPTQDFEQTYFTQANSSSYLSTSNNQHQAAEQQFSRSFCAPSQGVGGGANFVQQQAQQQYYDAPQTQGVGARRRLELSAQHQALSRSWCAGAAGPTRPDRQQTTQFSSRPRVRPLNSSDNLLRPQQHQQQTQQQQWTSSQQQWPAGDESFNNNRQLQDTSASWGQNQFVSDEQQQQPAVSLRVRQHEQLMRSMPTSGGDTFAPRPQWLASGAEASFARWQPGAK